jgi:membrane protein DedA with SNARE-associated domain
MVAMRMAAGQSGRSAVRGRRLSPLDVLCVGALAAQVAWGSLSVLLIPGLIGTHPVLLEVLNASAATMVGAGGFVGVGRASFAAAVVAPLLLWVPLDTIAWWAGRRYGRAVVEFAARWRPGLSDAADRAERLLSRFGPGLLLVAPWLPIPDQITFAGLGEAGMPLWRFVLGDAIGVLLRASALVALGAALGDRAVAVTTAMSRYALVIVGVALLVALATASARRLRRRRRTAPEPAGPEPAGPEPAGPEPAGPEPADPECVGSGAGGSGAA